MNLRSPPCEGLEKGRKIERADIKAFEEYLRINLRLSPSTVLDTVERIRKFLRRSNWIVSYETVKEYLKSYLNHKPATYNAELKVLKRFAKFLGISEMMQSFKSAPVDETPPEIPTNDQVRKGFEAQTDVESKALYLFIATTGLRKSEVLNLRRENIDFKTRAVKPNHYTRSKRSGITFYNEECERYLKQYLKTRTDGDPRVFRISERKWRIIFNRASEATGVRITAKSLRRWHSQRLGELMVPDRFIDIFQGRAPRSVIAKYYTAKGIERLKEIYEGAGLKIISST